MLRQNNRIRIYFTNFFLNYFCSCWDTADSGDSNCRIEISFFDEIHDVSSYNSSDSGEYRDIIPSTNRIKILGFNRRCASHKIPKSIPRKNVDPYNSGPSIKFRIWVSPDSRITIPTNNEKNNGDATGNRKHKITHKSTARSQIYILGYWFSRSFAFHFNSS